jgi:feruloyl esterase
MTNIIGRAAASALVAAFASAAVQAGPGAATPASSAQSSSAETACDELSGQVVGGSRLTTALVAAVRTTPAYCKVSGVIAPKLNFEIRLPEAWNGKLYYGGGGGYDGLIPSVVAAPLAQGYAEVASDSGHQDPTGMSAAFIANDPLAAELFGTRAVPTVMAVAVRVIAAAYGAPPARSYFEGCSTGGREALMAVQRNPELFDGVIARAPAFNWVGMTGAFNAVARAAAQPGAAFSPAKVELLARHVREACDGLDGVVDGIVANPAACTPELIHLASLRCSGGDDSGDACLSDAQMAVVQAWTSDHRFNGARLYLSKGFNLTGNEDDPAGFGLWATGNGDVTQGGDFIMQDSAVKYVLARDPAADSLKYVPFDRDPKALDAMARLDDATDPDIRPFIRRGGRLIVWQGSADAALSVNSTIGYMSRVRRVVGAANAAVATRFYVAPGVNHCTGGAGPDQTDLLTALDQWVTKGRAPGDLVARKLDASGAVIRSLPLCRYPQYPRYVGAAHDADAAKLASSYVCTTPQPRQANSRTRP